MENDILTGVESEGESIDVLDDEIKEKDNAFEDNPTEEDQTENENSDESSAETNEDEKEPSQKGEPEKDNTSDEKDIPFHKHPRFQEIIEQNKKLKDELENVKQDVFSRLDEVKPKPVEKIPESFAKLFGDNIEIWNTWKEYMNQEKTSIREDVMSDIKKTSDEKLKEKQLEKQKETEAQKYFENQFAEIESADGKIDRNAVIKVLDKYHCMDPKTQLYDIKAAYSIYKMTHQKDSDKLNKRKAIVDASTSTGGTNISEQKNTWDNIHRKGWGQY